MFKNVVSILSVVPFENIADMSERLEKIGLIICCLMLLLIFSNMLRK